MNLLEYKGYHAKISFDAQDALLIGEVFGINDSLNFHGASVAELKDAFHQCIDNYLDVCKKIQKNPDKEFKGNFNIRIPSDLHRKLALEATRHDVSLNQFIKDVLTQATTVPQA
nr:type II toxin-antitoxin system HicB family antitoxin [uncultured Selenomonas sp.]